MKLVIIESPYADGRDPRVLARNMAYLRQAMRDSLTRGEAPFASHALYTQEGVLNDHVPEERKLGIEAGLAWGRKADLTAVYGDLGITSGMKLGIEQATVAGRLVEYRSLPGWSSDFVVGTKVRIRACLQGYACQCGSTGVIIDTDAAGRQRYKVTLDGEARGSVWCRPEDLELRA